MTIVFSVMMIVLFQDIGNMIFLVMKEYIARPVIGLYGDDLNLLDMRYPESIGNDGDELLLVDTAKSYGYIISRTGVMEIARSGLNTSGLPLDCDIRENVSF